MNTNPQEYDTHTETVDTLETDRDHLDNTAVTFNIYANNAKANAQFLNMTFSETIHMISPEIHIEERLDRKHSRFRHGKIHVEILDKHAQTLGEITRPINDLGHEVRPEYSFVPIVRLNRKTPHYKINTINVYIDPQ